MMAQNTAPPNWGRWQGQYQQNQEYSPMDTSGLVQYDPRVPTSAPLPPQQQQQPPQPQQPPHSSQYSMGTTYSMSSIPSMAPQPGFAMHNYTPSSPTPVAMQYRSYAQDRSPVSEGPHELAYQRDQRLGYREGDQGPIAPMKREQPQMPSQRPLPPVTKQTTPPETISPSVKAEEKKFENDSPIDRMMKAIQQSHDEDDEGMEDEDMNSDSGYPSSPPSDDESKPSPGGPASRRRTNKKKMKCPHPGCKRTCNQKTHLRIHMRKHTGDKPYLCTWPGCHHRFSQHGNLKTHYRRHNGEKPFVCDTCGKAFAQRGNLGAHKAVHDPNKRFQCIIADCGKMFSQRGNLKSHQNKFHKEAVEMFTSKFATMTEKDIDNPQDLELFRHFKEIYKNMNKGIKGRGKGRTIKKPSEKAPVHPEPPMYPMQQRTPPMEHSMPHHFPPVPHYQQHGLPQLQTWQNYSLPREGSYHIMIDRAPRAAYEMYDMDQESMSSGSVNAATISTPATSVYEEDHSRGLAFRDRMYA